MNFLAGRAADRTQYIAKAKRLLQSSSGRRVWSLYSLREAEKWSTFAAPPSNFR